MAKIGRPMTYPQLLLLEASGDVLLFRAHGNVRKSAKRYAARHGYSVEVEAQDEPEAVRADMGVLWRVVRL